MKDSSEKTGPHIYDVIVVGGGASGMMAGLIAGERGRRVLVIEKNKSMGEKLKITGGGRCNITHDERDMHKLLPMYGKSEQFLYSPFSQFSVKDTFTFFESRGLPLVVQARNRAFPKTERSLDVYKTLEKYMKSAGVKVLTNSPVLRVAHEENRIKSVVTKDGEYLAENFVFATGGVSHPETGSTGDGFKFLERLGHTIKSPTPTIVPLQVRDPWVHTLAGVSLSFMKITFFCEGKRSFSKKGKILFTHFGLSGPLILNSAKLVADLLQAGVVTAEIDCYPDTNHGALEAKLVGVFDNNKNKVLKNIMKEIVPEGMSEAVSSLLKSEVDPATKVHSVTVPMRKAMVRVLKALPLTIEGLMGFDRAVVADGGVPLSEIDTKTMGSKIIKNLYITGDLLHINRPTGGQSLQLCWTTGFVAGSHA